ncbi:uncharacterized protein LOC121257522 [Juglans microcarpa x Juglans regia]|uniref:uncharacterized protein LOC121257522 n=1 Tax=Juglans microcarpa x Juglans regia TaxID=2249226 RepID=UPI001B7EB2BE|nr:uncharacterized protein LOC121257522 [Juglans microcarpa x Juglans regia]
MQSHTNLSHAYSQSFLLHNGFKSPAELPISNLECIRMQCSMEYTSLKDLLPERRTYSSWYSEIPIKNPLVKHAALAYLQPMSTPMREKGLFRRLREQCCSCQSGCFGVFTWLCDAVSSIKLTSRVEVSGVEYNAEDEDHQQDEKHQMS